MRKIAIHIPALSIFMFFMLMALASVPTQKNYYRKPVTYPCIQYPPITYSPILLRINIDGNYTMKDLSSARQATPSIIMDELYKYNYSYKLADGVAPNLVLNVTFTNDGYDHFGVSLKVDWQGQASFTITLPSTYITLQQLIADMAKELNKWVANGWHSGNCN